MRGPFRRGLVMTVGLVIGASSLAVVGAVGQSGAAAAAPVLGSFECYAATATASAAVPVPFSGTPHNMTLENSFSATGVIVSPGAVQMHCNPAQNSTGHSTPTPVPNPSAHLLCRTISQKGLGLPSLVTLKNQFGTGSLKPTAVRSYCLPSWRSDATPTFPKAAAPANLDAYLCYTVAHPTGTPAFKPPASVRLKDHFGTVTTGVGAPNLACVATSEIVNGTASKLVNPGHVAVCFSLPASRVTPHTIYDKNRFGVGAVKLGRNTELCVPSVTVAVPPSTTTTAVAHHVVTSYTDPSIAGPYDIAAGPDGALWFTNNNNYSTTASGGSIGRITTSGVVTSYTDSTISQPDSITKGSDGGMWFTNIGNSSIGRITTDGTGAIANYIGPKVAGPTRITVGPDGLEWFTTQANTVGWITATGGVVTYSDPRISDPQGITAGPDGALWFANFDSNTIGRIATSGIVTTYSDPAISSPLSITLGPDHALWFTNLNNTIGRITSGGAVTSFGDPSISYPVGIVAGSDGAVWFTNYGNNTIGRISTSGAVTNYADPSISRPNGITSGPDGAIWFANSGNDSIGRISV